MRPLLHEIRRRPLLWLLVFVPALFACDVALPQAHTLHFVLSVLAIIPLAALLSHATEAVAARTGDTVGGLLNATLGNLTELVISVIALSAGQYALVKASIAGVIVTNLLFMLGFSMFLGGLRHHVQKFNVAAARLQAGILLLAAFALVVPSAIAASDMARFTAISRAHSLGLAVLLILAYALAMVFSLRTHREVFAESSNDAHDEASMPIGPAVVALAGVTILIALVSEVFVASLSHAAEKLGMTPAFVGFIVVPLIGGAAEMASAFSAARKDRMDLSVGIAMGSASQILLFVAPVLLFASYVVGPSPMDLLFWPGAVVMLLMATVTATFVVGFGYSAWFLGVQLLVMYFIFATTFYLLPP
jgi:Ca2+:H+ antiporter